MKKEYRPINEKSDSEAIFKDFSIHTVKKSRFNFLNKSTDKNNTEGNESLLGGSADNAKKEKFSIRLLNRDSKQKNEEIEAPNDHRYLVFNEVPEPDIKFGHAKLKKKGGEVYLVPKNHYKKHEFKAPLRYVNSNSPLEKGDFRFIIENPEKNNMETIIHGGRKKIKITGLIYSQSESSTTEAEKLLNDAKDKAKKLKLPIIVIKEKEDPYKEYQLTSNGEEFSVSTQDKKYNFALNKDEWTFNTYDEENRYSGFPLENELEHIYGYLMSRGLYNHDDINQIKILYTERDRDRKKAKPFDDGDNINHLIKRYGYGENEKAIHITKNGAFRESFISFNEKVQKHGDAITLVNNFKSKNILSPEKAKEVAQEAYNNAKSPEEKIKIEDFWKEAYPNISRQWKQKSTENKAI